MSSRVLRPADAVPVAAMEWRSARGSGVPAPRRGVAEKSPEPQSADAESELHARLETSRRQGRAEGEAAAAQLASQNLDPVIASFRGVIGDLVQQRKRLRAEAEEDTVKLAIAIARRVLHRELSTDSDAMLGLVKAAFGKLNVRETHRLRVSPEDAAALEENRARLELPPGLEISRDASLRRGSAVFETARGELDASVDTQLAEIERGLTDIMRRRAK